jgi:hypothetical protein
VGNSGDSTEVEVEVGKVSQGEAGLGEGEEIGLLNGPSRALFVECLPRRYWKSDELTDSREAACGGEGKGDDGEAFAVIFDCVKVCKVGIT